MPAALPVRPAVLLLAAAVLAACEAAETGAPDPPPGAASALPAPAPAPADSLYTRPDGETSGAAVAILVDNSGSMAGRVRGESRRKNLLARDAIREALEATRQHVRDNPDYPIRVGIYRFSGGVERMLPIGPYDSAKVSKALASFPRPRGNTAIGDAMEAARRDLYESGLIRKYILVITDGENTTGREPAEVAAEIARRSEGGVGMYYIAFDVDAGHFDFVREAGGEVLAARGGAQLRTALAEVYRGRILAESEDYGDAFPQPATGAASPDRSQQR